MIKPLIVLPHPFLPTTSPTPIQTNSKCVVGRLCGPPPSRPSFEIPLQRGYSAYAKKHCTTATHSLSSAAGCGEAAAAVEEVAVEAAPALPTGSRSKQPTKAQRRPQTKELERRSDPCTGNRAEVDATDEDAEGDAADEDAEADAADEDAGDDDACMPSSSLSVSAQRKL